nr:sulfite exporter TauE/SafE family protein [Halarchaeum solikamskense]
MGVFALVGLLGGAHCIGMCGPLASLYAERYDDRRGGIERSTLVRQQLTFNLGRTAGYIALGFTFGLLGTVLYGAAAVSRYGTLVRALFGVVVGTFIVSVGLYRLSGRMGSVLDRVPGGRLGGRAFGRLHRSVSSALDGWVVPPRVLVLGATHSVLPCPLLFPAYLYAFTQADPVSGAVALGVLGISTTPTMLAVGTTAGSLNGRHGMLSRRALGAVFLVMGYIPLSHGLSMLGIAVPTVHLPFYHPLLLP